MKGCHWQRRRFSLQALCVVHSSPTHEEEPSTSSSTVDSKLAPTAGAVEGSGRRQSRGRNLLHPLHATKEHPKLPPSSPPAKSHYKVVVLGSARTGKTSLVGQFWYAAFSPRYRPTVDDMHAVELDCNGVNLRLDILDTGGSYAFPAMRSLAIQGADGFILVCAVDNPESLQEVELARSQIFEIKGTSAPIVVVVNKTDLIQPRRSNTDRPSDTGSPFLCLEMVESLVTCDWGHGFVAASAKNNTNVTQVFQELFVQAKSRIALSPAVRKRRQSLPARVLLPNQLPQLNHLHNLSLQDATTSDDTPLRIHPVVPAKRNSCTVS